LNPFFLERVFLCFFGNDNTISLSNEKEGRRGLKSSKYTDQELIKIAKKHKEQFTTMRNWDSYAAPLNLPLSHIYRSRFGGWNQAKTFISINHNKQAEIRRSIIKKVMPYKKFITSAKKWNEFAGDDLPDSQTIIYHFGKWNNFKKELGIQSTEEAKRQKYIEIARKHIGHFSKSASVWKQYARKNNLPSLNTYINVFGSWANAQKAVGVKLEKIEEKVYKYDRDELIQIAQEHIDYFVHSSLWNTYAKEKGLPSQFAYINEFGSMLEAKKAIGIKDIPTRLNYTKDYLLTIAKEHIHHFTTEKNWDRFAKENGLPRYRAYVKAFGSWNNSKRYVYQEKDE
jgi:hypothetical protein